MYTFEYQSGETEEEKKAYVVNYYQGYKYDKIDDNSFTFEYLNNKFKVELQENTFSIEWMERIVQMM